MKDSTFTINDSIMNLNYKIEAINHKLDSIMTVNKEMMVHKNYFSDIIDTQMDWFALVFLITFGLLGLTYWFGIYRYFKKSFWELEQNNKNTRNSLITRITQKDKANNTKIESKYEILDKKINSIEGLLAKVFQEKIDSLRKEVDRINEDNNKTICSTEKEIKEIIQQQESEFEKNKKELSKEIWQTNFDTKRSMFISCYKSKAYSSALTWLIPMLKMIAEKKVEEPINTSANLAKTCAEKADVDDTLKERYDAFVKQLEDAEDAIEGKENKEKIKNVRMQLNKTYYSKIDLEEEKE